jgi:uncharacterized protein (DUF608 family)
MICLQGTGSLGSVSVRNRPDVEKEPMIFSAIALTGQNIARVVEAPVPDFKFFMKSNSTGNAWMDPGNGRGGKNYGLPRFASGEFSARFPFATIRLADGALPVEAELTGWSPFIPGDEDASSLPFAALEYRFTNTGKDPLDAVYYFCSENFMALDGNANVRAIPNGFVLEQPPDPEAPHVQGAFCASVDEEARVDVAWFRGGWYDPLTMLWTGIQNAVSADKRYPDPRKGPSSGGTLSVPFRLQPGQSRTIRLHLSWYVPDSQVREGKDGPCDGCGDAAPEHYRPWYAARFGSIDEINGAWLARYDDLRARTARFTDCFHDSTLPEEILEAVSANLSILKSPTVLRQTDGRLWGWEGCFDAGGSCSGSCTHVWNYAQAICNLFPRLERTLRGTEFRETQDEESGHQNFRACLPIRKTFDHGFHAASDGQLGGIIKTYRDWRICGDTQWLRDLWGRVRQSLDFCIRQWDPDHEGILKQPHHNTYDIEFWGPDGMCTCFYLGALKAACEMGRALGDDCGGYAALYQKGRKYLEENLYDGEYFYQKVLWKDLIRTADGQSVRDPLHLEEANSETAALLEREGPKYQYGAGCISDCVLGVWLAELSGLEDIIDEKKLRQSLLSIHRYNFKRDLSSHSNTQRPGYAAKKDAGLLLCTWPHGGKPSLPFVYCDEVWTGIEYQVASHLILKGFLQEGLEIVRACRHRYDGTVRNPYNEYECGHWYARAMASYALLQAYTGARYDALTGTLFVSAKNGPFRSFLSTATGYGTVEFKDGRVTMETVSGNLNVNKIEIC